MTQYNTLDPLYSSYNGTIFMQTSYPSDIPSFPSDIPSFPSDPVNPSNTLSLTNPHSTSTCVIAPYTQVERNLIAWETAATRLHNSDPTCVIDSFLYAQAPAIKDQFTIVPEKYSLSPSFALSFTVSKSSDTSETTKNKRNRKRQREGADSDEKTVTGGIGKYLHTRMQKGIVWSKTEDQMLCTLVLQFGCSWAFVCSVFLMEKLYSRSRVRRDCSSRWQFLKNNSMAMEAVIPKEATYLYIPSRPLSIRSNSLFGYVTGRTSHWLDLSHHVDGEKIDELPQRPFSALFSSVGVRATTSSSIKLIAMKEDGMAKLKEKLAVFSLEEIDKLKHLQRYMRPDPPLTPHIKDTGRRTVGMTKSMSQVKSGSGGNSLDGGKDKNQSVRVTVHTLSIPKPPNYVELRREAILNLPVIKISIEDAAMFKHLLAPTRTPQQNIVVPYEQAMIQARHLQEESSHRVQSPQVESDQELNDVLGMKRDGSSISPSPQPLTFPIDMTAGKDVDIGDFVGEPLQDKDMLIPAVTTNSREKEEVMTENAESEESMENDLRDICDDVVNEEVLPNSELVVENTLVPELPDESVSSVDEVQHSISLLRVRYPFLRLVTVVGSISHKRSVDEISNSSEQMEPPVNLKKQKLPVSVSKRLKRIQPTVAPKAFYHSVPQIRRSNVRLLQHNYNAIKQQMRNPKLIIQSLQSPAVKREPAGQAGVVTRESNENVVMQNYGGDLNRQRQAGNTGGNMLMYNNRATSQTPSGQRVSYVPVTQQRTGYPAQPPPEQPAFAGGHVVCV